MRRSQEYISLRRARHPCETHCVSLKHQFLEFRNGLTELYVEHRGTGPSLRMRRGEVIGELRLLGATEVHVPRVSDPVNPCHALYSFPLHPKTYRCTTESVDDAKGTTETVGSLLDSCMRFTHTGERVDSPTMP